MSRPAQLGPFVLFLLIGSSAASFITGAVIWFIRHNTSPESDPGSGLPIGPWLTAHGLLNPVMCALFGFLWTHYRAGWRMQVNRPSGVLMFTIFALLIASGAGLYYTGNESLRGVWQEMHEWTGVLLPIVLSWHAFAGWKRAKKG